LSTAPLVGGWLRRQVRKYGEGELNLTPVHQEPYPAPDRFQPWETCMTMGRSWAHNPGETDWKSAGQLICNLVSVVSRGGNYLLNVGPTALGSFPPEAVERLHSVGRWMKANDQSIYGATYTPLQNKQATRTGDRLHLHIFDWPADQRLVVEGFPGRAREISLGADGTLPFRQEGTRLEITLPAQAPDPHASVLNVEIDPTEAGWSAYSAPVPATKEPRTYLREQAAASFLINMLLNGALAFCAYSFYKHFSYYEVAKDILITVFVIAFLTAWIMTGSARGEYRKGNLTRHFNARRRSRRGLKLPKAPLLRGLLIGLFCSLVLGGLLAGAAYLFGPSGMGNWAYALLKTLYTGLSGALASALAVLSVVGEEEKPDHR
jgi:hypothetical protein